MSISRCVTLQEVVCLFLDRTLFGMPLLLPAAMAYGLLTLLSLSECRRDQLLPATEVLAWLLLGASAYYLWLSWQLQLLCSHCLAVHGLAWWLLPGLIPGRTALPLRLGAALLMTLMLHAAYHPARPALHAVATSIDPWLHSRIERGLHYGPAQAPYLGLLVLRPDCPHCAEDLDRIVAGLLPLIDQGKLQLRFVPALDLDNQAAEHRGRLLLAAAAEGRFVPVLRALLAAQGLTTNDDNLAAIAMSGQDGDSLARLADDPALALLLQAEQHLAAQSSGQTPRLQLWQGDTELAVYSGEIAAEVRKYLE